MRVGEVPFRAWRHQRDLRAGVLLRVDGVRGDEAAAAPQAPDSVAGRRAELGQVPFLIAFPFWVFRVCRLMRSLALLLVNGGVQVE